MSTAQAKRTTTTREIEGRDSVGLYLDEIARTPLLDAETEVELSKTIEAGIPGRTRCWWTARRLTPRTRRGRAAVELPALRPTSAV